MLLWLSDLVRGGRVRNVDMENPSSDTADVPLLFAVKYLIREYRNSIATLQFMLDENRDLFVPLPDDHPVALVIGGETMSPISLLLWAPYPVVEDVSRCPRALESLLAARCSPNLHGSPARAPTVDCGCIQ